eukprot:scpid109247/ scgid26707/ 
MTVHYYVRYVLVDCLAEGLEPGLIFMYILAGQGMPTCYIGVCWVQCDFSCLVVAACQYCAVVVSEFWVDQHLQHCEGHAYSRGPSSCNQYVFARLKVDIGPEFTYQLHCR